MQFKMVSTGDLHFGNLRIDSIAMYEKLREYFYPAATEAHLVTIGGDIYDQLITVGSKAHVAACKFIKDLFLISSKYGTEIRIMHGTYTHDRNQLSVFKALALPNTRFRIVNNIDCETIKGFHHRSGYLNMDLRVGYLPDNLTYKDSKEAVNHLKKVMQVSGMSKVDVLIGHGTFEHVIPPGSGHNPPCLYTYSQFADLVTGPIVMSHIHTPSRYRNVYYCGSFERMAHGEEENKGYYRFTYDGQSWSAVFKPNTKAVKFISIKPAENLDVAAAVKYFVDQTEKIFGSDTGYVRVVHPSSEVRAACSKMCFKRFPDLICTTKATPKKGEDIQLSPEFTPGAYEDVKITRVNLAEHVYDFLVKQHGANIDKNKIVNEIESILEEFDTEV